MDILTSKRRSRWALVAYLAAAWLAVAVIGDAQAIVGHWNRITLDSGPCTLRAGSGTPQSSVTGSVCDLYLRTNGSTGTTLYVKESGTATTTGWAAPSGGTSTVQVATVTLTNTQIKALPTTPVTLVAAPGAGLHLELLHVSARLDTTAGAYTNISDPSDLTIVAQPGVPWVSSALYNDSGVGATALSDFLGVAGTAYWRPLAIGYADSFNTANGLLVYTVNPASNYDNKSLSIQVTNGGGNFTGGNAANTLKVSLYYAVEAF